MWSRNVFQAHFVRFVIHEEKSTETSNRSEGVEAILPSPKRYKVRYRMTTVSGDLGRNALIVSMRGFRGIRKRLRSGRC